MLGFLTGFIIDTISQWGYPAIFVLISLSSMCIPIPSEIVLLFAGYLAYLGKLNLFTVITVGVAGNLLGSVVSYYIGLKGGRPLFLKYGKYVFVKEKELKWAEHWFERFGHETVFFGRMIPIIRAFISVPAGVAEMNPVKFNVYTLLGVLPWSIGLSYAGYMLGANWNKITGYFSVTSLVVAGLLGLVMLVFIIYHIRFRTERSATNAE